MFKALLKKQFLEINSYLFQNKKTGRLRDKKGVALYIVLISFLFLYFGVSCFFSMGSLCAPLFGAGLSWLYFSIVSLASVAVGVFGSVFNTYAGLYRAKDNDLLLSMPIPPFKILAVRIIGVFSSALMYESVIYIPSLVARFVYAPVTFAGVIFSLLLWVVLGALITFFTIVLGWIVALISSRLKNRTMVTVLAFILFFVLYYYLFFKVSDHITMIIAYVENIGNVLFNYAYPSYVFGIAAEGNALAFVGFTVATAVLLFTACYVMSKTFISITTSAKSRNKIKYKQKAVKVKGLSRALLLRETKRLFGSATVLLNCSSSTIMSVILGVMLFINKGVINDAVAGLGDLGEIVISLASLLSTALLLMIAVMNNISGPSVSLEAKTLDLTRSLPVKTSSFLLAKQKLHFIMTVIPVAFMAGCLIYILNIPLLGAVMLVVNGIIYAAFGAAYSLACGLKFPNLKWTNETIAVKQGAGNTIAVLGGMGIALFSGGIVYALSLVMPTALCLAVIGVIFTAFTVLLEFWIFKRGTEIFENL